MSQNDNSKRVASMLTIAQYKFKQALKKEDNEYRTPPVAVELSAQFLSDLDAVLKQNTPANVQKCTAWIVKHVASSRVRIASLGDYLVSISKSVFVEESAAASAKRAARSRFVPLLIINDVLHADRFHRRGAVKIGIFAKESMGYVPELVELATAFMSEKDSQNERKLRALINYWAINHLFDADEIKSLRDRADEGLLIAQGGTPVRRRNYLLPDYHGDRNAPWHDLPAAYMLEQLIRHPDRPIDWRRIKIAKLDKKPVSPHVRGLLDNFFENIDLKYMPTGDNPKGDTKKHNLWLDPMGQIVKKDKETDKISTVCNGYGWSMKLCQDMQKDGLPESIKMAREEAQREEEMEALRPAPQQRHNGPRYSPSPHRRRSVSSDSRYRRDRDRRGRSHSRDSSRSSYDSRPNSRSKGRDRSRSRRRRVSPQPDRMPHARGQNYSGRGGDKQRPPPKPYSKGGSSGSGQQWSEPDASKRGRGSSNHGQYATSSQHGAQGFSHASQPPFRAPSFPPQPPMPGQFPGQFPMQPFPPAPFQPGAFPGGVPPPPPPNYSGPFPPPPNMTAMSSHPYNFGGNQFSNDGYGNNNAGYGQRAGYGQNQGNFPGGGRGGFRGNNQGGGYNNRGGDGGQQRGQRGQRGGW